MISRWQHMEETAMRALVYLQYPQSSGLMSEIRSACCTMVFKDPTEYEMNWMRDWVLRKADRKTKNRIFSRY